MLHMNQEKNRARLSVARSYRERGLFCGGEDDSNFFVKTIVRWYQRQESEKNGSLDSNQKKNYLQPRIPIISRVKGRIDTKSEDDSREACVNKHSCIQEPKRVTIVKATAGKITDPGGGKQECQRSQRVDEKMTQRKKEGGGGVRLAFFKGECVWGGGRK